MKWNKTVYGWEWDTEWRKQWVKAIYDIVSGTPEESKEAEYRLRQLDKQSNDFDYLKDKE